jgi:hypothetical protein
MTGADFLMMMAVEAAESGLPYAGRFKDMIWAIHPLDGEAQLSTEVVAQRPLKDHELTPVSIIFTACQAAARQGDKESQVEVLNVGLSLLAKWPEYLAIRTEGHPTLQWKRDSGGSAGGGSSTT